jgi:hypothetical protein
LIGQEVHSEIIAEIDHIGTEIDILCLGGKRGELRNGWLRARLSKLDTHCLVIEQEL